MTEGQSAVDAHDVRRAGRRRRGWPWAIVGVVMALGKADALRVLLHGRVALMALFGLWLVLSVLRPRPVGIAVTVAGLLAFVIAPGSVLVGIGLGLGAFVLLMALFFAVATVLQARQPR
jgi:hypothetical protein